MNSKSFHIKNIYEFRTLALYWAENYPYVVYLNPNQYEHGFRHVLAVGSSEFIKGNSFQQLENFTQQHSGSWLFGHLSYDLKNDVEELSSLHPNMIGFPYLFFFKAEHLIFFDEQQITIYSAAPEEIYEDIISIEKLTPEESEPIDTLCSFSKEEYIDTIEKIKKRIIKGDLYELNFCVEFKAQGKIKPVPVYEKLNHASPMPFSCFYKCENRYLLSASPERFIKKEGNTIISQPIKGTAPRATNISEDKKIIEALRKSNKETAENVMIVDLVRNDLSKTAEDNSVVVDELCEIYTFKTVHQMISTVRSTIRKGVSPVEVIRQAFPMGSMTGAPKVKALQLIEEYERSRRGLFSGAVGYFTPEKDFDFNVVIRSILYNSSRKTISLQAGSAITWQCDAEKEYEECLLKAYVMRNTLNENQTVDIR